MWKGAFDNTYLWITKCVMHVPFECELCGCVYLMLPISTYIFTLLYTYGSIIGSTKWKCVSCYSRIFWNANNFFKWKMVNTNTNNECAKLQSKVTDHLNLEHYISKKETTKLKIQILYFIPFFPPFSSYCPFWMYFRRLFYSLIFLLFFAK